jgi:O-antigen/teichoic acid export membrane protein
MKFSSFIQSSSIRNFAKLLSANVVAQVIGLVVYPILTRIYAPEDFGLLNLFLSIGGVLAILSTAEYYYAIVLPKQDKDGNAVLAVGLLWLLATTVLVALTVLLSEPISQLFKSPELAQYYWMMPIYVMAVGAWNLLNYWYIRNKRYNPISRYQISQNLLSAGGKLGLGSVGILQSGMIYAVVFAPILSLAASLFASGRRLASALRELTWTDVREQARVYHNFPLYVLPRSFVNMLAGQMPVLLLTPFFGTKAVGFLSLAILLGYTPIGTITRAVYQVMYQHTMERVHQQQAIGDIFRKFLLTASAIIIPVFAVLWWVLPDLTAWLLGADWRLSGEYIRWMLPWLYVSLLSCSINYLFDVFMKQRWGLFFEVLLALMRIAGLAIGVWTGHFLWAVIGYSIATAVALVVQIVWMMAQVRAYDRSLVTTL